MSRISDGICILFDTSYVLGDKYHPYPKFCNSSKCRGSKCRVTVIDNKPYVNWYEFKNEKWRMTLKALWLYLF